MTIKPPEPKDTDRVVMRYEADATIGELVERDRLANEVARRAFDGLGKTHTLEEVEAAIRERANAGALLQAAKAHVTMMGVAEGMIQHLRGELARVQSSHPLSFFKRGQG